MNNLLTASLIILAGVATPGRVSQAIPARQETPAVGEARIWYLHHSGWAVQTAEHFLIFDYWEEDPPQGDRTLESGYIDPRAIADLDVTVFVTHAHGDHFDPVIFGWEDTIDDLRYIWGWTDLDRRDDLSFGTERRKVELDGMEIWNIHHSADGIPESAFLIRVDGITLYHSGDHGNSAGRPMRPDFRANIEYLHSLEMPVDLCFLPLWGYTGWQVEQLGTRHLFPMHAGGRESRLAIDAQQLRSDGVTIPVHVAAGRGARYHFSEGRIRKE
ncbi:MBL fold metallo-hydrolase [Candidatus Zixiibacteriota bacterium]